MSKDLPIWIMEPEQTEKRDLSARKLFEGGQRRLIFQRQLVLMSSNSSLRTSGNMPKPI